MPNAMIKCKTQLVKVEKENENKHIRRKNTTLHKADKVVLGKTETVWERLSKVRKSASIEDSLALGSKSKTTVRAKSAQRAPARASTNNNRVNVLGTNSFYLGFNNNIQYPSNPQFINPHAMPAMNQAKKPLAPQNIANKRDKFIEERKPSRRTLKQSQTPYDNVIVEEIPFCGISKRVEEILTARSLCHSKSSSDESKNSPQLKPCHSAQCQTDPTITRSHTHPKIVVNQHSHSENVNRMHSHYSQHSQHSQHSHPSHQSYQHMSCPTEGTSCTYSALSSPVRSQHSSPRTPLSQQNSSSQHSAKYSSMYSQPDSSKHCSPLQSPKYCASPNRSHGSSSHNSTKGSSSQQYSQAQSAPNSHSRNSPALSKIAFNLTNIRSVHPLEHTSSFSQNSFEIYQVPPLIPVPTNESLNSSIKIENKVESLLQRKKSKMAPDEIKLIKRVVRSDERYRQLHQSDEKLFKDILKSQLKEILQQGTIVKSALHKLADSESDNVTPSESQTEKTVGFIEETEQQQEQEQQQQQEKVQQQQQVNVVFKNVPSLEKEIIILRALGEKLEATLKRTSSHRTITISERRSTSTSMGRFQELKIIHGTLHVEHNAMLSVYVLGISTCLGIVKEFNIARKTIVELKQDSDRHFYLPLGGQRGELKRTNFRKLKQNPDILMRYLRPKSSMVPFNVLEQDPVFFNSFLYNINNTPRMLHGSGNQPASTKSCYEEESEESYQNLCLHEAGDSSKSALSSSRTNSEQFSLFHKRNYDHFPIDEVMYTKRDRDTDKHLYGGNRTRVTFDDEIYYKGREKEVEKESELPSPPSAPLIKQVHKKVQIIEKVSKATKVEKMPTTAPISQTPPSTPPPAPQPPAASDAVTAQKLVQRPRRRSVTPMPLYKYAEPKNNLIKTILVGSLQISVFLLLIMAITYPDYKC